MILNKVIKLPLSLKPFSTPRDRYILCYHNIVDENDPEYSDLYSTSPEKFRRQLNHLSKYFIFTSVCGIISEKTQKKPMMAVTFDDGYLSIKKHAMPILREKSIPITIFLNRTAIEEGRLDNITGEYSKHPNRPKQSFLRKQDLLELRKEEGISFGSHTASHPILSQCSLDQLAEEIEGNRDYLKSFLGAESCKLFAFPYGKKSHYNQKVIDFAVRAGHHALFTTNPSHFRDTDRNIYPRIPIMNESESELNFLCNRSLVKSVDL